MTSHYLRTALVLGLLSTLGPIATDMYLPALPSIGTSLGASMTEVQWSLMAFFISLGLGQMVYGPLSDRIGRKPPLYFGMLLFAAGSVGCALATDIQSLVAFRLMQGLGACAGMVVPRAIVRDLYTGAEATRLMSLLILVLSVSPLLAPLAGSLLIDWAGWRSVFWAIGVTAGIGLLLIATSLPETRPPSQIPLERPALGPVQAYLHLFRDRRFMGLAMIGAFGMASFFAYLANSSFVLIEQHGLTPRQYSLAFAVNAASFIGAAQFTGLLGARFGLAAVVRVGAAGFAAVMALLMVLHLAGLQQLGLMLVLLFIGYGFLGLVSPPATVLGLEEHGAIAGAASALLGTFQFAVGALVIAVVGLFSDGTARPMVVGIAVPAIAVYLLARGTLGGDAPAPHHPHPSSPNPS